ncbi:helix-turn-helix domain-containing protein [Salibacterium halotolerans]|uniref:Cro/C1-type HTH DNA-binding domain-containing protein n=1 Tax=Salibacterium halotolerans TaxID=1884432 RepID=A0A1I5Y3D5_9BACI|nr:helix-turn-helix transcriptional regulator [Salibacterium halotolerans]SFQ38689.1 Cro/C1-type HTH DNA-binding domain-containing protein [Salibacterium halotolerans]
MHLKLTLDHYLQEQGVTQKHLCEETGIRADTLSSMKRSDKVNLRVLETIMEYFEEDDISKLIEVIPD